MKYCFKTFLVVEMNKQWILHLYKYMFRFLTVSHRGPLSYPFIEHRIHCSAPMWQFNFFLSFNSTNIKLLNHRRKRLKEQLYISDYCYIVSDIQFVSPIFTVISGLNRTRHMNFYIVFLLNLFLSVPPVSHFGLRVSLPSSVLLKITPICHSPYSVFILSR